MAKEHNKTMGAPNAWDSSAGFLPVFAAGMAVLLLATLVLKGYIA